MAHALTMLTPLSLPAIGLNHPQTHTSNNLRYLPFNSMWFHSHELPFILVSFATGSLGWQLFVVNNSTWSITCKHTCVHPGCLHFVLDFLEAFSPIWNRQSSKHFTSIDTQLASYSCSQPLSNVLIVWHGTIAVFSKFQTWYQSRHRLASHVLVALPGARLLGHFSKGYEQIQWIFRLSVNINSFYTSSICHHPNWWLIRWL